MEQRQGESSILSVNRVQMLIDYTSQTLEQLEYERNNFQEQLGAMGLKISELGMERDILGEESKGLRETIRSLETGVDTTASNLADRDRQCEKLRNGLGEATAEVQRLLEETQQHLSSSIASRAEADTLRNDLESALAAKVQIQASLKMSHAHEQTLKQEVEDLHHRLKDVKQASADLEVKMLRLNKEKTQLEEDNSGLYMGLEAKQEELELVRIFEDAILIF